MGSGDRRDAKPAKERPGSRDEQVRLHWFFGSADYHGVTRQLRVNRVGVPLPPQQCRLLLTLLQARGQVVPAARLPAPPHQAITRLRRALGENARFIETVYGDGYRFAFGHDVWSEKVTGDGPLRSGEPVAHSQGFTRVGVPLARKPGLEVWQATNARGERRVYKLALDGARLPSLHREVALLTALNTRLPGRDDLQQLLSANLEESPYFLASTPAGESLGTWSGEGRLQGLPQEEILPLFLAIAGAVEAAHGAGVLHLDLNPSNILIRAPDSGAPPGWRACLVDFGSGRMAGGADLDGPAARREAPGSDALYVAPEVRMGGTGTAQSDVYALGYLLYQLLTRSLSRRIEVGWEKDIDDPLLVEDLGAALQSDPGERLTCVAALVGRVRTLGERRARAQAQALLAAQERQEAAARAASLRQAQIEQTTQPLQEELERLRRLRQEEALRSAQAMQAEIDRLRLARADLDRSEQRRREEALRAESAQQEALRAQRALKAERTARRHFTVAGALLFLALSLALMDATYRASAARTLTQIDQVRHQQVDAFMHELLERADPFAPDSGGDTRQDDLLALAEHGISAHLSDLPDEQATQLLTLSKGYFGHSQYDKAEELQRRSVELLEQARGEADERTVMARYLLVRTLDTRGDFAAADALVEKNDRLAAEPLKTPSRLTLFALSVKARNRLIQDHPYEAQRWFEDAEAVRAQVVPDDQAWRYEIRAGLAACYVRTHRSQEAVQILGELVGDAYPRRRLGLYEWSRLHLQYGLALRNLHRYREAETALSQVVEESTTMVTGGNNYIAGVALYELASTYQIEGQWQAATTHYQQARTIMAAANPQGHQVLEVQAALDALEYLGSRHPGTALPRLQRSFEKLQRQLGPPAPATQLAAYYYASALCDAGYADQAREVADGLDPKALAAADAGDGWDERLAALKGQLQIAGGHETEGRRQMKAAIDALTQQGGPAWLLQHLGRQQREQTAAAGVRPQRHARPHPVSVTHHGGRHAART